MSLKPVYVWNGSSWVQVGDGTPNIQTNVNISDSAPDGALEGSLWFDSETNGLYAYDGSYWVSVQGAQGPTGPTGPEGPTGPQGSQGEDADLSTASASIVSAIVDGAPVALDTLNKLADALQDNPDVLDLYLLQSSASNTYLSILSASSTYLTQTSASNTYSTKSSPIFTGNAVFDNITIVGTADISEIVESVYDASIVSGSATLSYSSGNIFYISSASDNFTANLTNVPTTNGKTITISIMVSQGATGYIPNVFAIDNSIQTIKWSAGVIPTPTSSVGKTDIFNFTLIRRSDVWTVFATSSLNF